MAHIIDGRKIADAVEADVAREVGKRKAKPCLAVILVGDDPASQIYVRKKKEACEKIGIISKQHFLPEKTSEKQLLSVVKKLNKDSKVHAILVQLPLPKHISEQKIIEAILPEKDVDGYHPINLGKVAAGKGELPSCTPAGVIELLDRSGISMDGKHAVVVGRSITVGRPMSLLLLSRNATVTTCHKHTKDLGHHTRQADILVVAVGKPGLITAGMVKPGAVVIDVGTTRVEGKVKGDVDFLPVSHIASYITPVPGGVGPMTVAMLMKSTLKCQDLCSK
jgi:methylenetetrahydrofolate dehydrogenase (NADP+)/methenyltetrahydrofolate cyclohydrolase